MPTISAADLTEFATQLLAAAGAAETEARCVAESLVGANLRGYDSHGVMRIPQYAGMIAKGEIVPGAELATLSETDALLAADAGWGFGQVQAWRLYERLADKVRRQGVALGTLRRSSHVGRLGEYCERAAADQLASIMMVNSHGAARRVAPPGGKAPRLGTNPIAFGSPRGDEPLVLDFSTSATAEGKVRVKRIAGETCPDGWLLDSEGRPTNDPNTLYNQPAGTILPFGGDQAYKGFGLGLMIDIFCGALSGGLVSRETPITPIGNCVFLLLIDPELAGGWMHFDEQVTQLADFVRGCPRIDGCDEIILPGDPERRVLARKQREGIALDDGNWRPLVECAEKLGVTPPV